MKKKNLIIAGIVAILFLCLCGLLSVASGSKNEEKQATQITEEDATEQPTAQPAETDTPQSPALVPGILPADVIINMENRGLACGEVSNLAEYYVRTCKKDIPSGTLFVEIYGKQLLTVDAISATITQTTVDPALTSDFLGFVATIPFVDNPDLQAQAKTWTEQSVQALQGSTVINGISYQVSGLQTALTLDIGEIK